jgi:hypothetical protein
VSEYASTRDHNGGDTVADAMDYAIQTVGTSSGMDVGGTGTPWVCPGGPSPRQVEPVCVFESVVVGVFDVEELAEGALDTFRREGFRREQIGFVKRSGALIVQADALAFADAADRGLPTALCELGVPEREALKFGREFDSGRCIVTVKPAGRTSYAVSVLERATGTSKPATKPAAQPDDAISRAPKRRKAEMATTGSRR